MQVRIIIDHATSSFSLLVVLWETVFTLVELWAKTAKTCFDSKIQNRLCSTDKRKYLWGGLQTPGLGGPPQVLNHWVFNRIAVLCEGRQVNYACVISKSSVFGLLIIWMHKLAADTTPLSALNKRQNKCKKIYLMQLCIFSPNCLGTSVSTRQHNSQKGDT